MDRKVIDILRGKIALKARCELETDAERQAVWDALDMQDARKPVLKLHENRVQGEQEEYYCPRCNEWITWDFRWKWCAECGQKLDWSGVK